MKTRSILTFGFALCLTMGAIAQTNPATPPQPASAPAENPNAADFKFETMEYNFGSIKQGDVVNHDFTFTNAGKEPLIITGASGSCGCTVPTYPKEPIQKGKSGKISVSFNSAGKMGIQDKTVTITSNAKNATTVLHVKGTVEAAEKKSVAPAAPAIAVPPAEKK